MSNPCQPKIWGKLTPLGRAVWRRVYADMKHQDDCKHPQTVKIPAMQWSTIRHNTACYAAWAAEDSVHSLPTKRKPIAGA